jgi:hypothetical protein
MHFIGWLPLSRISEPSRAAELIAAEETRISEDLGKLGEARPGLREQYALQIQNVKDEKLADGEIIVAPFFFPSPAGTFVPLGCTLRAGSPLLMRPHSSHSATWEVLHISRLWAEPPIFPWLYCTVTTISW